MNENLDLLKSAVDEQPENFESLFIMGMEHIRHLASSSWTDHNAHDPGVTILEQLCFALTDLNYRAGFPVEDLMAEGTVGPFTSHFRPRPMLTSGPVSMQDWRMLLLDVTGVTNVWIKQVDTANFNFKNRLYYDEIEGLLSLEPVVARQYAEPLALKGLYQIDYELNEDFNTEEEKVKQRIFSRFQQHRNIGEDLYQINRLKEYQVTVEARIEIREDPDPESVLAKVYAQMHDYISPSIHFYTLQEMLATGYQLDEIFLGPALQSGFLEKRELDQFGLRNSLRISDLISLIMDIDGVLAIHSLKIVADDGKIAGTGPLEPWELIIPESSVARLRIPGQETKSTPVELWHQGLIRQVNWQQSANTFKKLLQQNKGKKEKREMAELDQLPIVGRNRQVKSYQSVMHQFPDVYGIGINGLPPDSSSLRKAQARQLKAYLSFFDQLLANSFAQLGSLSRLFALDEKTTGENQTMFAESLIGESPGFEEIIDTSVYEDFLQHGNVSDEINQLRQKRLTQHLLARFGERFNDFSQQETEQQNSMQRLFLNQYPQLGYMRFKAFDYTGVSWDTDNISGLEQRLSYLLGFPDVRRRNISDLPEEHAGAFFMTEHILLRPGDGDEFQNSPIMLLPFNGDDQRPPQKDPYSLQLSFVFPNWLLRFKDTRYWQFLTATLREQTPAHLKIYMHLLDKEQMIAFEIAYHDWITQLKKSIA